MTGQSSDKVTVGDPLRIKASTWNSLIDVRDRFRSEHLGSPGQPNHVGISTDKIKAQNLTGGHRRLGEVCELEDILIDTVDPEHLWQEAVTPNTTRPFGVWRKDVPGTHIEEIQVSGVCKALVNVTNASHGYANVECANHVLQSGACGSVRILYKPVALGEQQCIVLLLGEHHTRIARTTAGGAAYPAFPANKFRVEFGSVDFAETPGCEDPVFTPLAGACGGSIQPVAMDIHGHYWPEGSIVIVECIGDRWFIIGAAVVQWIEADLDENVCPPEGEAEDTEIAVVSPKLLPNCLPISSVVATNPRKHRGKVGMRGLFHLRRCVDIGSGVGSGQTGTGNICSNSTFALADIDLRPVCHYVMIDDRDGCMVGAGLKSATEYCPDDEPPDAKLIADYDPCPGDPDPACDFAWEFDPLYACTGGVSGSGL